MRGKGKGSAKQGKVVQQQQQQQPPRDLRLPIAEAHNSPILPSHYIFINNLRLVKATGP
jgi:hypothetical protein